MEYLSQLEKAIIYLENNLHENIKVEEIATVCGYSYYHFHRIFQAVVGESVGSYLRKRRLTKASYDLIYTDKRILDIALYYQFESQEAFSRAFKALYKVSPGVYRKNRIQYFIGQKIKLDSEKLKHLTQGVTTQPEIKVISEKKIVGIRGTFALNNNKILELWNNFVPRISEIKNRKKEVASYSICEVNPEFDINKFTEETESNELVGVEAQSFKDVPNGMVMRVIKEGKYAVFTHKGTIDKIGLTYDYIWRTWILSSKFEVDLRDDFELYDEDFLGPDSEESRMYIYIPIK